MDSIIFWLTTDWHWAWVLGALIFWAVGSSGPSNGPYDPAAVDYSNNKWTGGMGL